MTDIRQDASPQELEQFFLPWPDGTLSAGRPMARVGWRMQFLFAQPGRPRTRDKLFEIVQEYLQLAGPHLKRYSTGPKEVFRPVPAGGTDLSALEAASKTSGSWVCNFTSAAKEADAEPWGFKGFASQITFRPDELAECIASFPITAFGDDAPAQLRALFRRWCGLISADQGYAGLGWILPPGLTAHKAAVRRMGQAALAFPGLDIDLPSTTSDEGRRGLRSPAWLTAVSDRLLERIGGAPKGPWLTKSGVTTHPYHGGLIFQAGEYPQIGDRSQDSSLDAYRAVARALLPARAPYKQSIFDAPSDDVAYAGLEPAEAAERYSQVWLTRFDRD